MRPTQPASAPSDVVQAWTPAEDAVLAGLHAEGKSLLSMSNQLYRTVHSVDRRLHQLGLRSAPGDQATEQPEAPAPKIRHCISCRNPFKSLGPHNRMCDRCRVKAANNRTPFDF